MGVGGTGVGVAVGGTGVGVGVGAGDSAGNVKLKSALFTPEAKVGC